MTDSYAIFTLATAMLTPVFAFLMLRFLAIREWISVPWAGRLWLASILIGLFGPLIVTRFVLVPNFGTVETFAAKEIREEINNTEIVQYLVYEDGTEYNLTRNTAKYYTELPNSEMTQETCIFLWVIKWDQRWFSGLDTVKRN